MALKSKLSPNKKRKGFNYVSAQNLLNQPPPPPNHIVENLLTPRLTILEAAPKSGKSYLLTHILAHIVRGMKAFLTRRTTKTKVLYLGLEDGVSRFHIRLQDFIDKDIFGNT